MRPSGRGAHHTRSESRTSPLLSEVRDLHVSPGPSSAHACTPTRRSGAIPRHNYRQNTAGRAAQSSQDEGRNPGRQRRTPPSHSGRQRRTPPSHSVLTTVSDHCTLRFRGKTTTCMLHSCTPPLLVTIKGGGGLPLAGCWTLVGLVSLASLLKRTHKDYQAHHLNRLHS